MGDLLHGGCKVVWLCDSRHAVPARRECVLSIFTCLQQHSCTWHLA